MKAFYLSTIFLLVLCIVQNSSYGNEVGWSIFDSQNSDWERLSGEGTLNIEEHSAQIYIPANQSSLWKLVFEPAWIYRFQELHITYRALHVRTESNTPFLSFDAGIIPVQPDESIPMSEWNSLDKYSVDSSIIIADGETHELVIPIYEKLRSNQMDEIIIELYSDGEDAALEILKFEVRDSKVETPIILFNIREWKLESSPFQYISMQTASNSKLHSVLLEENLPNPIEMSSVPFQLPDNRIIPSTSFYSRGEITVPVQNTCSEVYLLFGCDMAGSDYSFEMIKRKEIREPERLVIEKKYSDGTVERSFPYHISKQDYVVTPECGAYVVPADSSKILQEIRVLEWMSYGKVYLAAVTANTDAAPKIERIEKDVPWVSAKEQWQPQEINPSLTVQENKRFILQNSHYRMELLAEDGLWLTHLSHQKNQQNMLSAPSPLFSVLQNILILRYENFKVISFQAEEKRIRFHLNGGVDFPMQFLLTLNINKTDALEMSLELSLTGGSPKAVKVRFPLLENINISTQIEDDYYFFPRKRTAWGNQPVKIDGMYSGEFPLQWMDVYSQEQHAGIAVHTQDEKLNLKRYMLMKDDTSSRMAVEHGHFQPVVLNAGETFLSATSAIQIHDGDWHSALKRYQDWAQKFSVSSSKTYNQLDNVFITRRDYPIGGTDLLLDEDNNQYTFDKIIEDSKKYFSGVDLLDLSGWQYTQEHGTVGAYENWEIGTAENLHLNSISAQEDSVLTGLYLSGYLVDERSGIDPSLLYEWQIIDRDGNPLQRSEKELYMNPFHPDWQKHLSETAMRVLDMSGAQALYIDQFGFVDDGKADFSNRFAFPFGHPLLGEHVLLTQMRKVMEWMERPTAIYAEQVPVDLTARLLDGACSFGMTGDRDYPSPARLNAFHYAYPKFKIFEKIQPGIFPKAVDSSLVKLCFFHGHGLWLKGKAQSWYNRECLDVIQKAHRIYKAHQDAFTSADMNPMIPTLQRGLLANQFIEPNNKIITLYNVTPNTISGELVSSNNQTGHVVDEWGIPGFSFKHDGEHIIISGVIHPHEIGCFAIE